MKNDVIEVNNNFLFSGTHLVKTEKGLVEAQTLKEGDVVIGMKGESEIIRVIKCSERPKAPQWKPGFK